MKTYLKAIWIALCALFTTLSVCAGIFIIATPAHAAYTTTCVGNTFCSNAGQVGQAARSMWVDPSGLVYTSSNWNENIGSVVMYKDGKQAGSLMAHGGGSGSAIACSSVYCLVPCQFNSHQPDPTKQNGCVQMVQRAAPNTVTFIYGVSLNTTERYKDVICGLAQWGQFWAATDCGGRVMVYNNANVLQNSFAVASPGALAFDRNGNLWVAQGNVVRLYQRTTGTVLSTITLGANSNVTALYYDPTTQRLWVADSGPDAQIKIYGNTGILVATFGILNGYRDTTSGTPGQTGPARFAKVDAIGRDGSGNTYVLNKPYGQNFDLGRDAGTDLQVFNSAGKLIWRVESYNFEGVGAPDSTGSLFYTGTGILSANGYVANTVDPFTYPNDPRLVTDTTKYAGRGLGAGWEFDVNGQVGLAALDQNPDTAFMYHFAPGSYIAIPDGTPFNPPGSRIRCGFWLASNGDALACYDRPSGYIYHYHFAGFDSNGKPSWSAPTQYAIPVTMTGILARVLYLPDSGTMVLADRVTGSTDWTGIGSRVEVYHNWSTNRTSPLVINLNTALNPKTMAAAGNYLFVGYVHTVPNIDVFDLTTGALVATLTTSDPNIYIGNDVDSMYGLRATKLADGTYVITKDNYNGNSVIVYRWTP